MPLSFLRAIPTKSLNFNKDLAAAFRDYLLRTCVVIFAVDINKEMRRYKNQIKDKDLEQLAAVKKLGIKFLVSYDRDFEGFEEYTTPMAFIKYIGIKPSSSVY
jgi:predicted nucleic acid-binding protein